MANRKGKLKIVGLIAAGFLTGSVLSGGLIAWQYFKVFNQQYYDTILSNAGFARMIREGREEELLKIVEANIQQNMKSVDSLRGDDENRLDAFWYAQRYYERYKVPVPDDIKAILAKLPPDPRKQEFAASTLILIGDKAPDFTCDTLDGQTVSLSKLRGKVVLINFFAASCCPCGLEMPYLQSEAFEKIKDEDFSMIAIALDEQVDDVTKFRDAKGLKFPIAVDPDDSIYNLFAAGFIPRTFVIDKEGIVKWESGGLSKLQFQDLVDLIRKEIETENRPGL